jgi:hypothetical protein
VTAPGQALQGGGGTIGVSLNVGNIPDSVCARLQAAVSASNTVAVTYPARSSCSGGILLVKSGNASWDQNSITLNIPIRILNQSSQSIPLPIMVQFPDSGKKVIVPSGTSGVQTIHSCNADVWASAGPLWNFSKGSATSLAPGDSTSTKTVGNLLYAPATTVQMSYLTPVIAAVNGMPSLPNGLPPAAYDSSKLTVSPTGARYYRTLVRLRLKPLVTDSAVFALAARNRLTIIGKRDIENVFAQLPDSGTSYEKFQAIMARLKSEPILVTPVRIAADAETIIDNGRYPDDGTAQPRNL